MNKARQLATILAIAAATVTLALPTSTFAHKCHHKCKMECKSSTDHKKCMKDCMKECKEGKEGMMQK